MTMDDQVKYEKLQYDIDRETAKISALSSGKINKYEYLAGEEISISNEKEITKQAKFTHSLSEKDFEKEIKTIRNQEKKQVDALRGLKLEGQTKSIQEMFTKGYESDEN